MKSISKDGATKKGTLRKPKDPARPVASLHYSSAGSKQELVKLRASLVCYQRMYYCSRKIPHRSAAFSCVTLRNMEANREIKKKSLKDYPTGNYRFAAGCGKSERYEKSDSFVSTSSSPRNEYADRMITPTFHCPSAKKSPLGKGVI